MKSLLFVGGGVESVPGVARARELGWSTAVFDGDPSAPAFALADRARVVSTYDEAGAVAAARELADRSPGLHGVTSVAVDVPRTVAAIAAALGLPGPSVETARLASDKLAMKERFVAQGVPTSFGRRVADAGDLAELLRERGRSLVVKPVDSRGARGVRRLDAPDAAGACFDAARAESPSGRVMAEEWLAGPQVSSESLFVGGRCHHVGFSDRNYARLEQFAPYFVEDGGTLPSTLPPEPRRGLLDVVERAGRALGITDGPCKGDLVWSDGHPYVIEVAARLSGGWFCTDQIPLATGVDLMGAAFRVALGEDVDPEALRPSERGGVATRYFFPAPGRVTGLADASVLRGLPGVRRLELDLAVGDVVPPVTDHTRRVGCVIATGPDRALAIARARECVRRATIETVQEECCSAEPEP